MNLRLWKEKSEVYEWKRSSGLIYDFLFFFMIISSRDRLRSHQIEKNFYIFNIIINFNIFNIIKNYNKLWRPLALTGLSSSFFKYCAYAPK